MPGSAPSVWQQLRDQPLLLGDQGMEHMLRLYGIMLVLNGQLLCSLQCFQRFLGKLVIVHIHSTSIQIEIGS